jgi:uncharacterized protein (DUF924 family)
VAAIIDAILDYWFGELDGDGLSPPDRRVIWFRGGEAVDRHCRTQFSRWVEAALAGDLAHWADSDRGLMALVLLLDQFTRNIYRGTPRAFAGDPGALALASTAVAAERHLRLPTIHQVFLCLPYEHSEDLPTQRAGVALLDALFARTGLAQVAGFRDYAVAHRDVIARFGRFPHRNALLGRSSSPREIEYLAKHQGF